MREALIDLLNMTAWPMVEPEAYGTFHICFMLIGFEICALLAWILRGAGERSCRWILLSCGVVLFLSEIYKQCLYFYCIGDEGYDWSVFPFQFCSMPMYLCLISAFLKEGSLRNTMWSFMGFFNLLGGAISFFEPSGLLHGYWTLTLHSCLWHMMLVFIGLWLCMSGRAGYNLRDFISAAKMFLVLCAVAFCINLVFRGVSGGEVNMFFIGPSPNPIIVFSWIAGKFGWFTATVVYIPAVVAGAYIVYMISCFVRRKAQKVCN